jgi:DeoR family suf operon transcriptional repressor
VLGFVEQDSPDLIEKIFERRRDDRLKRAESRLHGLSFANRVRELTGILEEDGYLAESVLTEDGSWLVIEHNCAILDVARRYGAACTSELAFLRAAMPDAEVQRVKHKMAGDFVCAYRMRPHVT